MPNQLRVVVLKVADDLHCVCHMQWAVRTPEVKGMRVRLLTLDDVGVMLMLMQTAGAEIRLHWHLVAFCTLAAHTHAHTDFFGFLRG